MLHATLTLHVFPLKMYHCMDGFAAVHIGGKIQQFGSV